MSLRLKPRFSVYQFSIHLRAEKGSELFKKALVDKVGG